MSYYERLGPALEHEESRAPLPGVCYASLVDPKCNYAHLPLCTIAGLQLRLSDRRDAPPAAGYQVSSIKGHNEGPLRTDFIQGLPGFPCPFSETGALRFRNRLREGKLSVIVISAAMPNHRFDPKRPFGIVQKSRKFCTEQIMIVVQAFLAHFDQFKLTLTAELVLIKPLQTTVFSHDHLMTSSIALAPSAPG